MTSKQDGIIIAGLLLLSISAIAVTQYFYPTWLLITVLSLAGMCVAVVKWYAGADKFAVWRTLLWFVLTLVSFLGRSSVERWLTQATIPILAGLPFALWGLVVLPLLAYEILPTKYQKHRSAAWQAAAISGVALILLLPEML